MNDVPAQLTTPEPLPLLIDALPARVTLEIIKADERLFSTIFQGFSVRPAALAQGVVRGRLERELQRFPELANLLYETWRGLFTGLAATLDDPDFTPMAETLGALRAEYGAASLCYALLHTERDDVRAWAERLDELQAPIVSTPVDTPVETRGETVDRTVKLRQNLQALQSAQEALQQEVVALKQQLQQSQAREAESRKRADLLEARAEREQRRTRRALEEAAELRKALREAQTAREETPAAPPAPDLTGVIQEAIAVLRRGLGVPAAPAPTEVDETTITFTPPPPPAPLPRPSAPEGSITLPYGHGRKQVYRLDKLRQALALNDMDQLQRVREGLTRLSKSPDKEREALDMLAKAGIPKTLLTGPLHPAVLDGSNIANMSPAARGRLSYLTQARQAAWDEGYFPVIIIVDASLRHQVDDPDGLMEMVERGEITMATPGTSADPLLIEEAATRQATLLTNDRMTDWPAAKPLEKRHIELHRGKIYLGGFHSSGRWFY